MLLKKKSSIGTQEVLTRFYSTYTMSEIFYFLKDHVASVSINTRCNTLTGSELAVLNALSS